MRRTGDYMYSSNEEQYIDDYKTIDLLYERTPEYFIKKYLRVIEQLKINPEIVDYVSEFVDSWDNMVGVHIRSWYCQRRKFHDNSIFEREIDRLPKDQKFFFALITQMSISILQKNILTE